MDKLKISGCTVDDKGNISVDASKGVFEVMLNPGSYSHKYSISYNTPDVQGKSSKEMKYDSTNPEEVSFDIWLDGTGVVESTKNEDVKTQLDKLKKVAYIFDGKEHEPNPVRLLWGDLIFFGRLTALSVDYSMFTPGGNPLRAKVTLGFSEYTSSSEESHKANRTSPDLTHIIEVKEGDTLPLLCYRIYKQSSYYTDVAKINNLVSFRGLKAGTQLRFPPLR